MDTEYIKNTLQAEREYAERIMNGGENYDGADGARTVIKLCEIIDSLTRDIERLEAEYLGKD